MRWEIQSAHRLWPDLHARGFVRSDDARQGSASIADESASGVGLCRFVLASIGGPVARLPILSA